MDFVLSTAHKWGCNYVVLSDAWFGNTKITRTGLQAQAASVRDFRPDRSFIRRINPFAYAGDVADYGFYGQWGFKEYWQNCMRLDVAEYRSLNGAFVDLAR